MQGKKWNIQKDQLNKLNCDKYEEMWMSGWTHHQQRTYGFETLNLIARNKSLRSPKGGQSFSEGTTQAIKRKLRATTVQRVPDGELTTQYDKNSIEHIECEAIFKHKIIRSEYSNKDMLKNLWRVFNSGHDYGFAAVLTDFELDVDGDYMTKFKHIHWNNIVPSPDCDFIEEADWYIVREYVSRSFFMSLLDENDTIIDGTYDENAVKYIIENRLTTASDPRSIVSRDQEKGVVPIESVEVRTLYKRGLTEFVTYVPSMNAILRTTKNYDPRKDIPIHFYIPEPDPEFPYGVPAVIWTLGFQQAADTSLFSFLKQMELALNPPRKLYGNLKKGEFAYIPAATWMMGTNPNNKEEPVKIETTTMMQYPTISENISAHMLRNMNITDATVASDANVAGYSGTAPGVEMQRRDKTVTINQYQKRLEIFFAEWANHAIRSYLNSMTGEHAITVDETTRRKIWDVELANAERAEKNGEEPPETVIDGDRVKINFTELSVDRLAFEVRTGSLVEDENDKKLKNIQAMYVPFSQAINGVDDANKPAFANAIMVIMKRWAELADIDISEQLAGPINDSIEKQALQASMEEIMIMQQQQAQQQAQIDQLMGNQQQDGIPQPEMAGTPPQGAEPQPAGEVAMPPAEPI